MPSITRRCMCLLMSGLPLPSVITHPRCVLAPARRTGAAKPQVAAPRFSAHAHGITVWPDTANEQLRTCSPRAVMLTTRKGMKVEFVSWYSRVA